MALTGKNVSRGIAVGPALRYVPFRAEVSGEKLREDQTGEALARWRQTKQRACAELDGLEQRLRPRQPEQADIMAAHRDILMDPAMEEEVEELVQSERLSPDAAIARVYDSYAEILRESQNKMMQERAADLLDVKNRLLRCWLGEPERDLSALDRPVIVVADDLYPSDTAAIDRKNVLGIITQVGGSTSHTAIIARSYEIPAVLGVSGAMDALADGQTVILDGETGEIIPSPTAEELARYEEKAARVSAELREEKTCLDKEGVTLDGVRVQVRQNVAAAAPEELACAAYADGCGLFRTEFLYLDGDRLPGEEEQYQAYRRVLEAFGEKPVILRTMDIGGDKQLPGLELPEEKNPFLGVRGVRLSLEREELFRTQIRAILRASVHGSLKVMFPMVGGLEELRQAKALFREEGERLDKEGIPYDRQLKLGIMVEVPSVALIAEHAAREADFVSVGTNDLTQYLCAADRMDPAVRRYYQEYHPAVFRLLDHLARTFRQAGKDISICGELGGDPLAIPVLLGLGIDQLSMGAASLAGAKRVIRTLTMEEARELAGQALRLGTHEEIEACLRAFARRKKEETNVQ